MQLVQPPVIFGVPWPGGPEIKLSKAELGTLTKAAGILEEVRSHLTDETDTDIALAMYTIRELVEGVEAP